MANVQFVFLVILVIVNQSSQNTNNNRVAEEDVNPLAEAAAAILKEQGAENIGAMVNNFVQGGGAKQLGDMFLNNENAGQLLKGLGSLMGNAGGGGGGGQGFDPSMLTAAMSLLSSASSDGGESRDDASSGFDASSLFGLLGGLLGDGGGASGANLMDFLPTIMQTISAFTGPEANRRAASHESHSWLMPPALEKIHIAFDHFIHSEIGKNFIEKLGAEKFMKVFEDENGKYNYNKFVEMMENHSFRRHWIRMVTDKIAATISHVADPKIFKKYLTTFQHFFNSLLRTQGFPKTTFFDYNKPVETITSLANYVAKNVFNTKISSKQYVKPAVQYVQEIFKLAEKKGIINNAVDSRQLSDKLADTINMEIIEPIARVNRAYRFATKVPECDKYVMCLVNDENNDSEQMSLPGLKTALSKSTSLILSWSLSSTTKTSFWMLYGIITDKNNCAIYFNEKCNDFHLEEIKTTTEYVHNEL